MGYELRGLRVRTGVSQAQLARLTGIARSTISAYESGRRTPSPAIAERIAQELQRPSVTLYGHRKKVLALAQQYRFHNVRVFGSCARGEDGADSDVDLIVDGVHVTLLDISRFIQDASELMNGIKVDVVVGVPGASVRSIEAESVPL